MTILPQLRDQLAHARRAPILPQLRDALVAAPRPARRRRFALTALFAGGGMLATAGALAATGVLPVGAPVKPAHVNHDPHAAMGVAADVRLLPLRVPDPDGGPPWGLRIVTTTRGMVCLQAGRVVGDQLGVLGQDGLEGDDGRFHPLPPISDSWLACQLPDGSGQTFAAVDRSSYASGEAGRDRDCSTPGEKRSGRPKCPVADRRQLAYGLLGPQAASVTFAGGAKQELTAPEGAYLFVRARRNPHYGVGVGGGPMLGQGAAIRRIDYRDGTSCPPVDPKRPYCAPKGYVEPKPPKVSGSIRRSLRVSVGTYRVSRTLSVPKVTVRFRAPQAISGAGPMYLLEGRFDNQVKECRRVILFAPTNRDVAAGERVTLFGTVPPRCHGTLKGRVVLVNGAKFHNGDPAPTVGTFTRSFR
ncbi:MAG TPA: hypothetical protein VNS09_21530 [Solirubrobacter sp.]|nr:hypothetical protein [Solirubrobacter sp.]